MTNVCRGEEYRCTILCIDTYDKKIPTGRYYNRYLPEGKSFCGATQFFQEMESMLDEMNCPRAFSEMRYFVPTMETESGPSATEYRTGDAATFHIRIMFRQNASWQGSLTWLEGRQEQCFRSVLELILLMDSALSCGKVS